MKSLHLSHKQSMLCMAVILLLGFGFRMWLIAPYAMGPNEFSDDNGYLTGGITFMNTGYVSHAEPNERTANVCVGMPFLLSILFRVFGYTPQGMAAAHAAFSCFGLLTALGVYLLAQMLAGRLEGLMGAALCALEPGLATLNTVFLTETPFMCLNLFAIYFFLRCTRKWEFGSFWAGIACMMAAAYFKGLALLSVLIVIPVLIRRRLSVRKWLPKAVIIAIVFVLCFLPWWVRNERMLGDFVPFTSNRGDIQLMGSYSGFGYPEGTYEEKIIELDAQAWQHGYQDDQVRRFALRGEAGKERLAQWFAENPVSFVVSHVIYKPFMLTVSHNQSIYLMPEKLLMPIWWVCLLLAAWGLLSPLFGRIRPHDFYAPALLLLAVTMITAVYVPLARYGMPFKPLWLMYAGTGAADVLRRMIRR